MGLSGILAVFFCALFMTHYTWYNISHYAQVSSSFFSFLSCIRNVEKRGVEGEENERRAWCWCSCFNLFLFLN